ncbi:hypothetical protein ACJJTC_018528 [Scirpophaga incertulas]
MSVKCAGCPNGIKGENFMVCSRCPDRYHYTCLNLTKHDFVNFTKEFKDTSRSTSKITKALLKHLERENEQLRNSTKDLSQRLQQLEQLSRSNNLEIQCVPENKNEKLYNTIQHLGDKKPVYVSEHLTPESKSLHAASRLKAKQLNYKFVWVRDGKVFVRKTESSSFILIKDSLALDKLT